jgi:hypothetical protein
LAVDLPPKVYSKRSGVNGLYAFPTALGFRGIANDGFQPGRLVFGFVGGRVGGGRAARLGSHGWEAFIEETRILRGYLGAVLCVIGL